MEQIKENQDAKKEPNRRELKHQEPTRKNKIREQTKKSREHKKGPPQ